MLRLTPQQISAGLALIAAAVILFGPMVWRAFHPTPPREIVFTRVVDAKGS
jgi:hypothetical protein